MVARRSDAARTLPDGVREASERLDDLARAAGRPTTQMRNEVGHVIALTSQSPLPMLIPKVSGDTTADASLDSALRFADGALSVRNPTDTDFRDLNARSINSTVSVNAGLDLYAKRNLVADGLVYATGLRANLGAPGVGYQGYGTWHGNVQGDGVDTSVTGGYVGSGGNMYAAVDVNAGRSVGAVLNVIAGGAVTDALGNVRNGASMPDQKTDVVPIKAADALAALAKLNYYTFRYINDQSGVRFAGPMLPEIADDGLLSTTVRMGDDGSPESFNIQSMVGLIAAALPAIQTNLNDTYGSLAPLQRVAAELPHIVAHSDEVHDALTQGQAAIGQAVASIQQASSNLGSSLSSLTQLAAQAQASAAIANATATAAGQRCAALEARAASLEAKVADHEVRIAALEARRTRTFRAAGNLPTLALNGTSDVVCAWTSAVPNPLPAVDQCQTFVAGSATPTVKSVSAAGVTVTLRAVGALLPAPGAVQVMATTW